MYKNAISLIGFVGKDPKVKMTDGGKKYALFSLATNEYIGRTEDGTKKDRTDWHRVIAWGKLADYVEGYIRQGCHVAVDGPVRHSTYEKDGRIFFGVSVKADAVLKLDRTPKTAPAKPGRGRTAPKKQVARKKATQRQFSELDF
ncbi:MAG: single-stranded DNA-binding protein [Holophagaceae bacterium]|nr:single-stranded DNA-binding protein [Holophagaceae bacterium]